MSRGAIITVDRSLVRIDPRLGDVRHPARWSTARAVGFEVVFDYLTVFDDLFRDDNGRVLAIGGILPRHLADPGALRVARADTGEPCRLTRLPSRSIRHALLHVVEPDPGPGGLLLSLGGQEVARPVQPNLSSLFAGRRVLVTVSKDNPLVWIADWARFHQVHHGVDAVVVYDNNSSAYAPGDVASALAAVPGIATVAVLHWDDPYGPEAWRGTNTNLRWSRWLQSVVLEHARRRLMARAAWMLNVDVDELLVTRSGRTVDDVLANGSAPVAVFSSFRAGRPPGMSTPPRHREFDRIVLRPVPTELKWAAVPERLPDSARFRVHRVAGVSSCDVPPQDLMVAHCLELTTGWGGREARLRGDGAVQRQPVDPVLRQRLDEGLAGWEPEVGVWSAATSGDPDLLRAEAQRLAAAGEAGAALGVLQEAIRRDPWHPAQAELRRDLLAKVGAARGGRA